MVKRVKPLLSGLVSTANCHNLRMIFRPLALVERALAAINCVAILPLQPHFFAPTLSCPAEAKRELKNRGLRGC